MHITKIWFDGDEVVMDHIPVSEIYKQEPVAIFQVYFDNAWHDKQPDEMWMFTADRGWDEDDVRVLYTTPPAAQPAPVQEPVATVWQQVETGRNRVTMTGDITDCDASWVKAADLYTTPPAAQRQWVGLTDNEVESTFHEVDEDGIGLFSLCRAIEAKLKEKNT
jgi:hypothetical protein